jgi:hypothetical protein
MAASIPLKRFLSAYSSFQKTMETKRAYFNPGKVLDLASDGASLASYANS